MSSRREISPRLRVAICAAAIGLGLLSPAITLAQAESQAIVPSPPPSPPSHLVRQLLELDARQALAEERAKVKSPIPTNPFGETPLNADPATTETQAPPKPPTARLLAIVGVGKRLVAHIQVGERQAAYLGGSTSRIAGPDLGLSTLEISPPCATFSIRDQDASTYCLDERAP